MSTQFETWWEEEGNNDFTTRELCRTAWENGAYCAVNKFNISEHILSGTPLPLPTFKRIN